jgi:phosphoribosylaminoimidazolecarboxamide formyltransferase/IMP cyclohydrolase
MLKIQKALISVSDKSGVVEFAQFLAAQGVEIISTGGTAKALEQAGLKVTPIREITGNEKDDYFDGRMKTISFQFESALLFKRSDPKHTAQARELGIPQIDMVVCNLYPFEKATADPGVSMDTAVENVDIGGPCMVRAAAKNYEGVAVVVDPNFYPEIMDEMKNNSGCVSADMRLRLAAAAFERTAAYDTAISAFFAGRVSNYLHKRLSFVLGEQLGRYAENWHQKGWLYRDPYCPAPNVPNARQVHGGPLGYNNYLDAEAALACALELRGGLPAVCIIKHSNPCGLATGKTTLQAMERAWQGDPVSAFGSVIALTHPLDMDTAKFIEDRFVEVVAAPSVNEDALEFIRGLGDKKKGLRLLEYGNTGSGEAAPPTRLRAIIGGLLEQESDELYYLCDSPDGLVRDASEHTCPNSGKALMVGQVTKKKFPQDRAGLIDFALRHAKHVKSNAIVIAREYEPGAYQALGMGCGQPNRKDSVLLCGMRAVDNLRREHLAQSGKGEDRDAALSSMSAADRDAYLSAEDAYVESQLQSDAVLLASDAFFPFRDGLDNAAETRVKHIVQPGGSVRDDAVIAAADEHGIAMVFTGVRKFNH